MARGIKRKARAALKRVSNEIAGHAQGDKFASGLASEGYAGGYRDALADVLLVLDGVPPCSRPQYWSRNHHGEGE